MGFLAKDIPIEYSLELSKNLVKKSVEPIMLDRTVIVDTNYLIQVNQKDILGMFFDPKYENTVASPLKRQMAKLFRNVMNRKIDLSF